MKYIIHSAVFFFVVTALIEIAAKFHLSACATSAITFSYGMMHGLIFVLHLINSKD